MKQAERMQAAVLAAAIACGLAAVPGRASAAGDVGWRVGSVVATALYAPAKLLYAATGVVAGGIGWGLSGGNREALDVVMTPALKGDYVITPEHLRGERRLEFVGAAPGSRVSDPSLAGSGDGEGSYEDFDFGY